MAKLKQLLDPVTGEKILPVTSAAAVYDKDGVSIETMTTELREIRDGLPEELEKAKDSAKSAAQSAKDAADWVENVKEAMENLPDGQAVSAQVAKNAADIDTLGEKIDDSIAGMAQKANKEELKDASERIEYLENVSKEYATKEELGGKADAIVEQSEPAYNHVNIKSNETISILKDMDWDEYFIEAENIANPVKNTTSDGVTSSVQGCFLILNGTATADKLNGTSFRVLQNYTLGNNVGKRLLFMYKRDYLDGDTNGYAYVTIQKSDGTRQTFSSDRGSFEGTITVDIDADMTSVATASLYGMTVGKGNTLNNYKIFGGVYIVDASTIIKPISELSQKEYPFINSLWYLSNIISKKKVDEFVSEKVGNLNNLKTSNKSNLVSALNEVVDKPSNAALPYITPEQYGAYGDGEHDDTTAFQTAINAALQKYNHKPFKAFGKYNVSASIRVGYNLGIQNNFDIFINKLNYTGTDTAIQLCLRYGGRLEVNEIKSCGKGIEFPIDSFGMKYMSVSLGRINSESHCMHIHKSNDNTSTWSGVLAGVCIDVNDLNSNSGNCLRVEDMFADVVLNGNGCYPKCNEPNFAFYFEKAGTWNISGFMFESECYAGFESDEGTLLKLSNMRTREMEDRVIFGEDKGIFCKGKMPMILGGITVDFVALKLTKYNPSYEYDDAIGFGHNVVNVIPIDRISNWYYGTKREANADNQYNSELGNGDLRCNKFNPEPDLEIATYHNRKMLRYRNHGQARYDISEDYNMNGARQLAHPTIFNITDSSRIDLDVSYCSLAINKITVIQSIEGKYCSIYDENNNLIFNGEKTGVGEYEITFRLANERIGNSRGEFIWQKSDDEVIVERLSYISAT